MIRSLCCRRWGQQNQAMNINEVFSQRIGFRGVLPKR